jgi:hypothetical protein
MPDSAEVEATAMTLDDLKKIFLGKTLFRLDTILSPKLVPVLYGVGLAALLLWAVIHLFATFGRNFGDGLWGLLEIAVFGMLALLVLRVVCEFLLVYFKANETVVRAVALSRAPSTLMDEVKDALHDIAEETEETDPLADIGGDEVPPTVRRTARRGPKTTPDL